MTLITTPVPRKTPVPKMVSCRLTQAQAKTFRHLGGAAWLRAQLDAVAVANAKVKK